MTNWTILPHLNQAINTTVAESCMTTGYKCNLIFRVHKTDVSIVLLLVIELIVNGSEVTVIPFPWKFIGLTSSSHWNVIVYKKEPEKQD